MSDTRRFPHIADAQLSLLDPECDRYYTVQQGDTCDTIAKAQGAPTLVSSESHLTFAHFTHALQCSYQIVCENDIKADCTDLRAGTVNLF